MRPTNKYKTHRPDCQHPWGTPDVCGCLQENLYDRIAELEGEVTVADRISADCVGSYGEALFDLDKALKLASEFEAENGILRTEKHADAEVIAALVEALDATLQKPMGVVPQCAERFYDGTVGAFAIAKAKGMHNDT